MTSSVVGVHTPFVTVQRNVALEPAAIPVTVVVADDGSVIVALPLTMDHAPVPTTGFAAVMVKEDALQSVWSVPAKDTLGNS